MREVVLEIDKVSHYYEKESEPFLVLNNINIDVTAHEFISVVGPSGCGKSTLIFLIAGFIRPSRGKIRHRGVDIVGPSPERGVVFQGDAIFPWLTVYKNVEFGLKNKKISNDRRDEIVRKYIRLVELDGCENMYPKQLSGGMKKRVDIARTLAMDPNTLLLDEPFGSVDAQTKETLQLELLNLWRREKKTTLFVTHDIEEAVFLADRVLIMSRNPGEFVEEINIEFERPRDVKLKTCKEFQDVRYKIIKIIGKLVGK